MEVKIKNKLNTFLLKNYPLDEECQVIYLLVELRKLIKKEWTGTKIAPEYPIVLFYADWALHSRKDIITPEMKAVLQAIDNALVEIYPKNDKLDFLQMPEFRKELTKMLEDKNIYTHFCLADQEWLNFILILIDILSDQPILNPTDNIKEFKYVAVEKEGVMATIDFRGNKEKTSITLGFGI